MSDKPLDLDKHRGMAAQKATDIRRILAEVETNARDLRDRQTIVESQFLSVPAASWPEAAAKARYVLNLYAAGLAAPTPVIAIWSRPCLRTSTGSRMQPEHSAILRRTPAASHPIERRTFDDAGGLSCGRAT